MQFDTLIERANLTILPALIAFGTTQKERSCFSSSDPVISASCGTLVGERLGTIAFLAKLVGEATGRAWRR
jgi:hypothetical protein